MKCKSNKLFFLVFCIFTLTQGLSFAEDLYVCKSGEGQGNTDGSNWANCFNGFSDVSWGAGAGSVGAADTLYIDGGSAGKTYNESLSVGATGSEGNRLTIAVGQDSGHNGLVTISGAGINIGSDSYDYVTINGEYDGARHLKVYQNSTSGIHISGDYAQVLYVTLYDNGQGESSDADGVYIGQNTDHWEIAYCDMQSNYGCAVQAHSTQSTSGAYGTNSIHHNTITKIKYDGLKNCEQGTDIYNNTIEGYEAGHTGAHLDYIQTTGYGNKYMRVYNNYFGPATTWNSCILIGSGATTIQYIQIYNNVFEDGTDTASYPRPLNMRAQAATTNSTWNHVLIANNVMYGFDYPGIKITHDGGVAYNYFGTGIKILNNVIWNCSRTSYFSIYLVGSNASNIELDYNITYSDGAGNASVSFGGVLYDDFNDPDWLSNHPTLSHNLTINPSLDGDFKPDASDDPVVNAGIDSISGIFNTDKDGNSRPAGEWDIGAYEYKEILESPKNLRIIN